MGSWLDLVWIIHNTQTERKHLHIKNIATEGSVAVESISANFMIYPSAQDPLHHEACCTPWHFVECHNMFGTTEDKRQF